MTHPGFHKNGLTQVLADVVEGLRLSVDKDVYGADLLHSLLNTPWLNALLRIYEYLLEYRMASPKPYLLYASGLCHEIISEMRVLAAPSLEARQLYLLLIGSHFQALLSAHDSIAQRDYGPVLPPLPDKLPDGEEAMRIVCLIKNKQPLGATIKKDEKTGEIFIARVIHGGLADLSGLLYPGDKLVEVNGEPVEGLEPEQVIEILVHAEGTVLFKLIPNPPQKDNSQDTVNTNAQLYMKALVDYNPLKDPAMPCPDAGMAFKRGDVLEIVDQRDPQWWQARRLLNINTCAGLIPSTSYFKSKQRELWWSQPHQVHTCIKLLSAADVGEDDISEGDVEADEEAFDSAEQGKLMEGFTVAGFRHSLRLCRRRTFSKRRQSCTSCHNFASSPYEEVLNYQRSVTDPSRLIVLTGPSGVGINELRRRVLKLNPNTFQAPVPYTTRPQRSDEVSGREYHFVTKELFEAMRANHRFIEFGEQRGHMYGTCIDSITNVLSSGKICIIDIEPHCIQAVRTKKLKPFIVFVKPPSIECMKLTRWDPMYVASSYFKKTFNKEDFAEMEKACRIMEKQYSQYFDCVLVNDQFHSACLNLLADIQNAQEQPQWIPASWISFDEY